MVDDERWLRRSIEVAAQARRRGDHPFGAVLVGGDGVVLAEAMNSVGTTGDRDRSRRAQPHRRRVGHAERNLIADASARLTPDVLAAATMYASTEPCAMCAAATYWGGVGRLVFGLPEDELRDLTGSDPENPTLSLPCRTVFAAGQRPTDVVGPLLADEARVVHDGFWQPGG